VIPAERFSLVDRLLDAALDRPVAARSAWLEEACGGDAALRVEVEELLRLAESDEPLFESGPLPGTIWDDALNEIESMDELAPGDRVGSYEIRGLIGRGGMGAVYRAKDATLGREVAIKALTHSFAPDASTLRRFEREAKLLASLNHPNIAVIHDLVLVEDRSYLVLELVEGETLSQRLARGAMELSEVIRIATQLADALEEAHRKGVVHRDLKPSNVKLTPEGRVKEDSRPDPAGDAGLAPPVARRTLRRAPRRRARDPGCLAARSGAAGLDQAAYLPRWRLSRVEPRRPPHRLHEPSGRERGSLRRSRGRKRSARASGVGGADQDPGFVVRGRRPRLL